MVIGFLRQYGWLTAMVSVSVAAIVLGSTIEIEEEPLEPTQPQRCEDLRGEAREACFDYELERAWEIADPDG